MNESVERTPNVSTNGSLDDYRPIIPLRSTTSLLKFRFCASDLCYVSSLHDGMNLVAKEYAPPAGTSRECWCSANSPARREPPALIVNPYNLEKQRRYRRAEMPLEEQRDRMRSMRSILVQYNVYRWAGRMLMDAARLRNQERVAGRLSDRSNVAPAV